jgi:hypothetical protein
MSTRFRNTSVLLIAVSTLALSAAAQAQLRPGASEEQKQKQEQKQEQRSEPPRRAERADAGRAAPRQQAAQAQARRPGYQAAAPQPERSDRPAITSGDGTRQYSTDRDRYDGNRDGARRPGFVPRPGYIGDRDRDGGRGDWNGGREHRPPRIVQRLPPGYRDYRWNGSRYYYYGGSWYRPYGSSYISIGVPYGLFVTTLPGAYSSFWFGGSRYFYADDTYYLYEPERRGYIVTRSPYGDDEDQDEQGEELYIYPARGQSEQQQADDRYECHRWAADQSHYDPIDDEYDADEHEDYLRAMTACLTGRGYTVK